MTPFHMFQNNSNSFCTKTQPKYEIFVQIFTAFFLGIFTIVGHLLILVADVLRAKHGDSFENYGVRIANHKTCRNFAHIISARENMKYWKL